MSEYKRNLALTFTMIFCGMAIGVSVAGGFGYLFGGALGWVISMIIIWLYDHRYSK